MFWPPKRSDWITVKEQYFKQVVDGNRGAHDKGFLTNRFGGSATNYSIKGNGGATGFENAVNGNTRISDFRYMKPGGAIYEFKYCPVGSLN